MQLKKKITIIETRPNYSPISFLLITDQMYWKRPTEALSVKIRLKTEK